MGKVYVSKRSGKEKVRLEVLIDKELYEKLKEIATRYGVHRGALSMAIEEAIRLFLESSNADPQPRNRPDVRTVFDQVLKKVIELEGLDSKPLEIPRKVLEQAIREVRGSDSRTVAKWIKLFLEYGFIRFRDPYNRIVEFL